MNIKKSPHLLGAFATLLVAGSAFAQGSGNGTNNYDYSHNYSYSNHWNFTNSGPGPWYSDMSRWTNATRARVWTNHNRVVGPGQGLRAGGPPTPADVQAMVQQFQQDRESFMAQRRTLERKMASASEQERQQIRDQLRDQLDQWKQDQARVRDQLRDQADRLRDQLRDHTRLMDQVSNPGTSPGGPRGR
jgi:gas vesicle protein